MPITPGASTEMGVHYLTWEAQTQPQSPPEGGRVSLTFDPGHYLVLISGCRPGTQ